MVEDQADAKILSPTAKSAKSDTAAPEEDTMDVDTANVTTELDLPVDVQGTMAFYPFSSLKPANQGTMRLAKTN